MAGTVDKSETGAGSRAAHLERRPEPREFDSFTDEVVRRRGVPKTPQGWMTLGLTVMAVLIAVALWLRS
jgi:hypothetical protein